jgi:hypothetical protein
LLAIGQTIREHVFLLLTAVNPTGLRPYTRETNRLDRQRWSSSESTRREFAEDAKAIAEIVRVIEQGGWHRALRDRLTELEAKQDSFTPAEGKPWLSTAQTWALHLRQHA